MTLASEWKWSCDRDDFEDGPWKDEPDRVSWTDEATGYPCLIVRGGVGALCGYVGVPPGHPFYGSHYDDVDVDVHGGLTYAASCHGGICHDPPPGEDDSRWWLGFDCGHWDDGTPRLKSLAETDRMMEAAGKYPPRMVSIWGPPKQYKTIDWVRAETTRLAAALASA